MSAFNEEAGVFLVAVSVWLPSTLVSVLAAKLVGEADNNSKNIMVSSLLPNIQVLSCLLMANTRSEEHTSELQSRPHLVCRLLLEKKKQRLLKTNNAHNNLT